MHWTNVTAFTGGVFISGLVCYAVGAAKGYALAIRHMTAVGTAVLQNVASSQAKQHQHSKSVSTSSHLN